MKTRSQNHPPSQSVDLPVTAQASFNPDDYHHFVAEFGMDAAQEKELLETLWKIMYGFVEMGWGVESMQLAMPELFLDVAEDSNNLLESNETDFENLNLGDEDA